MKLKTLQLCVVVLFISLLSTGSALGYSTVVTFGDSLSDNGNISRFSDGALWVEQLANRYSADLYDYAYGGATTGYDNPAIGSLGTGLLWQVETFGAVLGTAPASDTIVTLWAGGNDFLQSRSPYDAVNNIGTALINLYAAGGRNFVVPNLPDIGKTPSFFLKDPGISPLASAWSSAFNSGLEKMLYDFGELYADVDLFFVDAFTIFEQYDAGSPEWNELFWDDGFHPSSAGHTRIFEAAVSAMDPVPEPATLLLFATGLAGFARARRTKKVTA